MRHHEKDHDSRGDSSLRERLGRVTGTAEALGGTQEHRRDVLVEQAEDRGLPRPAAEQAYDIAREVGLEPALGIALVIEGLSVRALPSPRPDVDTSEPNEPEWVDAPPAPDLADRERRLRQTFRRLRSHLDRSDGAEAAVRAFGSEPDLEPHDY